LIGALKDEFLYVRICAAGALGSIGLKTDVVLAALKEAANDRAMRAEVEWALQQITGVAPPPATAVFSGDVRSGTPELPELRDLPVTGTSRRAATSRSVVRVPNLGRRGLGGVVYVNGQRRQGIRPSP
jgi:hypothetical protein